MLNFKTNRSKLNEFDLKFGFSVKSCTRSELFILSTCIYTIGNQDFRRVRYSNVCLYFTIQQLRANYHGISEN